MGASASDPDEGFVVPAPDAEPSLATACLVVGTVVGNVVPLVPAAAVVGCVAGLGIWSGRVSRSASFSSGSHPVSLSRLTNPTCRTAGQFSLSQPTSSAFV